MGEQGEIEVVRQLVKRTHSRGTLTPSPPGQPPAKISGDLADSVRAEAPRSFGTYVWASKVGGHTVYWRIQGMGGVTGRNHATTLPPRPYLEPAMREGASRVSAAGQREFRRVVLG
jgi:phage gpG-like protein